MRQYSLGCAACQQAAKCGASTDGIAYTPDLAAPASNGLVLLSLAVALLLAAKRGA